MVQLIAAIIGKSVEVSVVVIVAIVVARWMGVAI